MVTVRAEMSRLRKQFVGLVAGKPYRFGDSGGRGCPLSPGHVLIARVLDGSGRSCGSSVYLDLMVADPTLLDGLDGEAGAQRAELVEWLLSRGITADQIRQAVTPMLLASRRVAGDDGTYVSTREISEQTGLDVALVQRLQRAMGLATVDDPDAAVLLRADAEAVGFAERFLELGIAPDQLVLITRVLSEGLGRAAEVMRYAALAAVLTPGATELETAKASEALVAEAAPLIGPMIRDMLFVQLRHAMETEAVSASGAGRGASAARCAVGHHRVRRHRRVHPAGRGRAARRP